MTSQATQRRFPPSKRKIGEQLVPVHRLECFECGAEVFMNITKSTSIPDEAVANYFRNKGWNIGRRADRCICATCVQKNLAAQREKAAKSKAEKQTFKEADMKPENKNISPVDRRIIYSEIDGAYGNSGYKPGYTDASLAEGLGVKVEWVAEIREHFFGPAVDHREAEAMIKRIDDAVATGKEMAESLIAASEDLKQRATDLIAGLSALTEEARRVQAAMVR